LLFTQKVKVTKILYTTYSYSIEWQM